MLIDEIEVAAVWTPSDVRTIAGTGSVLVSAELSGTGEEISDEYSLEVTNRAGGTGDITVTSASKNNPYDGNSQVGVNFDDTTEYTEIIPGVTLVFDNAAVNADDVIVNVGQPQGGFDASGVGAGTPTAGVRHKVTNDGASGVSDAKARLLPQVVLIELDDTLFEYVHYFAEAGIEKTAGGGSNRVMPYKISVELVTGVDAAKVVTLHIDGALFGADSIQDVTLGTLSDSEDLKATDPSYQYLVVDGPLTGLKFAIHADAALNDEANILIFNSRFVQIAPDVAGVAGTWGTADVDLTESGESTGVITAAGEAYYWSRFLVPASANNESNPHPCNIALESSEAQDAGWEA